ncbi:MAG: rRNA maturation RNase YbeY [Bdellovibrionales bacterium]|nr:rRNA maturation RNase YbeY [Bdellovibrionales bacterium]
MVVNLLNNSSVPMPKSYLRRAVQCVFKELTKVHLNKNFKNSEMSLIFLDPPAAKKLNKQYRHKNYATDVLSFPAQQPFLGELIMCPQVLKLQAQEQKHSFRQETLYMVIHGILHLLGYEHEKDVKQANIMFALQEELFIKTLHKLNK